MSLWILALFGPTPVGVLSAAVVEVESASMGYTGNFCDNENGNLASGYTASCYFALCYGMVILFSVKLSGSCNLAITL